MMPSAWEMRLWLGITLALAWGGYGWIVWQMVTSKAPPPVLSGSEQVTWGAWGMLGLCGFFLLFATRVVVGFLCERRDKGGP